MTSRTGRPSNRLSRPAFTLVELILVIALLVVSAGLLVANLAGWHRYAFLDEGADQYVTLLRMARAESANRGRCLRLSFGEDNVASVLWESDPLGAPGQFEAFPGVWAQRLPADLVRVSDCRLIGPSAFRTLWTSDGSGEASESPEAVTFYPDGSSDSARLMLANVNPQDTRVGVIELNGLTGTVSRRILTAQQWQEEQQQP